MKPPSTEFYGHLIVLIPVEANKRLFEVLRDDLLVRKVVCFVEANYGSCLGGLGEHSMPSFEVHRAELFCLEQLFSALNYEAWNRGRDNFRGTLRLTLLFRRNKDHPVRSLGQYKYFVCRVTDKMVRAKLKSALARYQGKNFKLERQKKLQKEAEKRKKSKAPKHEDDEMSEEDEGIEFDVFGQDGEQVNENDADENDDWESWESEEEDDDDDAEEAEESDEEDNGVDLEALNESDSDSEEANDAAGSLRLNGKVAPSAVTTKTTRKSRPDMNHPLPDENEDIPLSDLSSVSDTDDIVPHQRLTVNNTAALERALSSIALPVASLPLSEHQSITTEEPINIPDIDDELNRELAFYSQSLSSVKAVRALLRKEGVPFSRPADYFAEMVKSDEHMGKVKSKLISEAAGKKAAQEARRQRDLKKFGKQVQQEKLKERAKEKREMLDKVKILKRKRQSSGVEGAGEDDMFDVALDEAATGEKKRGNARARDAGGQPNTKRAKKNERFGFGGKKKYNKSGDAKSSGDMSGFSTKKMKGQAVGKGASKRLGKSRRSKMK